MPIYQKINTIMKRVVGVAKEGHNSHGNYDFASHNAVTRALRGHYAELGVVREAGINQIDVLDGGHLKVTGSVTFTDSEDVSQITLPFVTIQHCQTSKGQVTAQQAGQALSYAVKNVELKLFALTDTQGDSDSSSPTQEAEAPVDAGVAKARAAELLKMMGTANGKPQIDEIMAAVKAEWDVLKTVDSFYESMQAQRNSALKRWERWEDDIPF